MKRAEYPIALRSLIQELKRLPGIGSRSAERIALWMTRNADARPQNLAKAIHNLQESVTTCTECGFFSDAATCGVCTDPNRDNRFLCVVEQATDILPIERSGAFTGLYHALGGKLSPLDHIGPDALRIPELLRRITIQSPSEIILALGADVEGEATAQYLADLLRSHSISVSRLAQGIPAGTGLEYTDELTLNRALSGRILVQSPRFSATFTESITPSPTSSSHA